MAKFTVEEFLGGYVRTGSNRIYPTREAAEASARRAELSRALYYGRTMGIAYSDIYNSVVTSSDIPKSSPPYDFYEGTSSGRAFKRYWGDTHIWDDTTQKIPLMELVQQAKYDNELYDLLTTYALVHNSSTVLTLIEYYAR